MAATRRITINFPGGIVSPGYLKVVLEIAADATVKAVRFGNRQQLFIEVPPNKFKVFCASCRAREIRFSLSDDIAPNIVTSYPAAGIFTADTWVSEGVYKDILGMFDYTPAVKINVCDSKQTFVPLFNGHINWIASQQSHFWYLYVRFPKSDQVFCVPELIYTNDIGYVSQAVENALRQEAGKKRDGQSLYREIKKSIDPTAKPIVNALELPVFRLPYYEGFNSYGTGYWLGIYRRDEMYPVAFLQEMCTLCLATKTGELYLTPWKSIIIKNIAADDRLEWDYLLGKYRINVRHAANELNWQVEDNSEDGLIIKRHIIRYFDKEDVRTYGLCFAVETRQNAANFGSVLIRLENKYEQARLKSYDRYSIYFTQGFNPNSTEYVLYREQVQKEHLGPYVVSLCKKYYEMQGTERQQKAVSPTPVPATTAPKPCDAGGVYRCRHCFTMYDPIAGEPERNIEPGTKFDALPTDYTCPLCEAAKEEFIALLPHPLKTL